MDGEGPGRGVAVKDACSGVVVVGGSSRDLSKNILNGRGWVKAKVVRRGEGVLKESPPLPAGKF